MYSSSHPSHAEWGKEGRQRKPVLMMHENLTGVMMLPILFTGCASPLGDAGEPLAVIWNDRLISHSEGVVNERGNLGLVDDTVENR